MGPYTESSSKRLSLIDAPICANQPDAAFNGWFDRNISFQVIQFDVFQIFYIYTAQNKVDGVIALTYSDIGRYIADDIPLVVFDRFFENHQIPRIATDNFNGAVMAVEKLLELGCHHPVYIRFHSIFPGESDKRLDGYLYACKKHGLEPDYLNEEDSPQQLDQMRRYFKSFR